VSTDEGESEAGLVRAVLGGGGQGDDADDSCRSPLPRVVVVDDIDVLLPSARRSGLPRTLSIYTSLYG
jgi:hypothetical protein